MAIFTLQAVHAGGGQIHGFGISDFTVASFQNQTVLYAASATDGGVTAFSLGAGLPAVMQSDIAGGAATGTLGVADIEVTYFWGNPVLVPAGRYDDAFAYLRLDSSGNFTGVATAPTISQSTAALTVVEVLTFGTSTYMIAGRDNGAGLDVFSLTSGYGVSHVSSLLDDVGTTLANVSDLVTINTGMVSLVIAASSLESGVTSMAIDASGNLNAVDMIDGLRGYGIYRASTLATVKVGTKDFLIVGASGSNNLTVFEIGATGDLRFRDMVWDSLDTRFRGATAIETFSIGDRAFVFAGGSDGGLTLFEIGPDGKLYFETNVIDTVATTLASVSAIEVVNVAGEIQVFVASANEEGITQFSLDLGAIGNMVVPSGPSSSAVGGNGDDFLFGTDDRDILWGMKGNDRLVDGAGIDTIYGGPGADTFVFVNDGMYDRLMDFEPGIDKIDLSSFDRVYSMSSFDIVPTVYGARIDLGADSIAIETQNGQSLTAAEFSMASFIF